MRILHLEDDRSIRDGVHRQLRQFHVVDGAMDVNAAIGLILANNYDLVMSDFDLLNGETGLDLLSWLRANKPDLKFMFISGNAIVPTLGVVFVEKPCRKHELLAAIEEATRPTFEPSLPDRPHIDDPSDGRAGGAPQ